MAVEEAEREVPRRGVGRIWEEVKERVFPGEEALSADEDRILAIIRKNPDGIRLVNIGNELGVDWRSLLPFANSLVSKGIVERVEGTYYPKGRVPSEEN